MEINNKVLKTEEKMPYEAPKANILQTNGGNVLDESLPYIDAGGQYNALRILRF